MSQPDPLTMLAAGLSEAKAARATIDRAITALEQALQQGIQDGLASLSFGDDEHASYSEGNAMRVDRLRLVYDAKNKES